MLSDSPRTFKLFQKLKLDITEPLLVVLSPGSLHLKEAVSSLSYLEGLCLLFDFYINPFFSLIYMQIVNKIKYSGKNIYITKIREYNLRDMISKTVTNES